MFYLAVKSAKYLEIFGNVIADIVKTNKKSGLMNGNNEERLVNSRIKFQSAAYGAKKNFT